MIERTKNFYCMNNYKFQDTEMQICTSRNGEGSPGGHHYVDIIPGIEKTLAYFVAQKHTPSM